MRRDAHAVPAQLGKQRQRIEQVLVARPKHAIVLVIGLDAQLEPGGKPLLEAENDHLRALRGPERRYAVLDLQLVDALGLLKLAPARAPRRPSPGRMQD